MCVLGDRRSFIQGCSLPPTPDAIHRHTRATVIDLVAYWPGRFLKDILKYTAGLESW